MAEEALPGVETAEVGKWTKVSPAVGEPTKKGGDRTTCPFLYSRTAPPGEPKRGIRTNQIYQ